MSVLRAVLAPSFLCLALQACASSSFDRKAGEDPVPLATLPPAERQAAAAELSQAFSQGMHDYRLGPGDVVEALFNVSSKPSLKDYRIAVGDALRVDFAGDPAATRTYVVRPDGRIALPAKGEVMAAGERPADLSREIARRYADTYQRPIATVNVERYSTETMEFLGTVTNAVGQRTQTLKVAPDGNINFPMLRSIKASGRTIDELTDAANLHYAQGYDNLTASLRLAQAAARKVYVFGEVHTPGAVTLDGASSILQIVAAAGGPTQDGALDQVRLLYWDAMAQAHVRQVDLNALLDKAALGEDMVVPSYSVVYVPPTGLARMGRFMDQLLRRAFMFNGSAVSFNFNQREDTQ